MTGLICLIAIVYTLAVAVLVYVNYAQGRELTEARAQVERLIDRIGADLRFESRSPASYRPNAVPQPPIGPVPQPMFTFKKGPDS